MSFFNSLSAEDISRYFRIIAQVVGVKRHFDLLVWLQGDVQAHLPHEIMLAAWGDLETGSFYHDIVSDLPGLRSESIPQETLAPLLKALFNQWLSQDRRPFLLREGESDLFGDGLGLHGPLGDGLRNARCALVHGITDERGQHDCLYVIFSSGSEYQEATCGAMEVLLPHIDTALRQVAHLPLQQKYRQVAKAPVEDSTLSQRELEIMHWVAMGKTNYEIGSILDISLFTVKNHMQRIFKKLDVANRLQATNKWKGPQGHG